MRIYIDLPPDTIEKLQELALRDNRYPKQEGEYLLKLAIAEAFRALESEPAEREPASVADLNGAANHCALSIRTLRRYLGDPAHPLPAHLVGGKVLIDRDELDEWVRAFPRHGQASAIVEEMLRDIGQRQRRPQG